MAAGEPAAPPRAGDRVFATLGAELVAAVREARPSRVVLQVPAGLVRNAGELAARLRAEVGAPVDVASRPCFGACDLPSRDEAPRAELAVVLGHAPIPNVASPHRTFFVEMREPHGDPDAIARGAAAAGLPHRLGLVASVQHLDLLPPLAATLGRAGFEVRLGRGDRRLAYLGQALGCNYTGAEEVEGSVEGFLFVGTGRFHPLGLALAVDRPVWSVDPRQGTFEPPVDRATMIARRQLLVASVRDAQRWGILVSTFAGQNRSPTALALQARARAHGRTAEILLAQRIDPADLLGRDVEAFVCTACPRIALDDSANYPKPVLTVPEFLMALGELPLEPYRFDTYH
ncbi:MAG TPA: diphthamide biosynthesis enzyme Dph2 [Thermoplasmata archaeon]|nr:diphthamide biosynthesis enzyme Dph2 [Thermoplasmata archaeon]